MQQVKVRIEAVKDFFGTLDVLNTKTNVLESTKITLKTGEKATISTDSYNYFNKLGNYFKVVVKPTEMQEQELEGLKKYTDDTIKQLNDDFSHKEENYKFQLSQKESIIVELRKAIDEKEQEILSLKNQLTPSVVASKNAEEDMQNAVADEEDLPTSPATKNKKGK